MNNSAVAAILGLALAGAGKQPDLPLGDIYARAWADWRGNDTEKMIGVLRDGTTIELGSGDKYSVGPSARDIYSKLAQIGKTIADLSYIAHNHNRGEAPSEADSNALESLRRMRFMGEFQTYHPRSGRIDNIKNRER